MTKKNDPSFNGSPLPTKRIRLTELEFFALRLACLTEYEESEPEAVTEARDRIRIAEFVADYFKRSGLTPIFGTFETTALKLKGGKK